MNYTNAAFPGAPIRAKELDYLVTHLRAGWCCAVVGPSNTGKSFLLKSLLMEEVVQHCTKTGWLTPIIVFVDCLEAGDSEHAFYELLLRRTIETLAYHDEVAAILPSLREFHRELLQAGPSEVTVRALYASSVRMVCQHHQAQLILILDEFYDVFRHLPPWPFRQLRALHDGLQRQLCFVTATSHFLENLRPDAAVYEFRELFQLHTMMLYPLSPADAQAFITYLADRQGETVSPENRQRLLELSGGHPGLLERIYSVATLTQVNMMAPLEMTTAELINLPPVQKECQRLWNELEAEQEGLLALLSDSTTALTAQQEALLSRKGLITQTAGQSQIFSLVLAQFIETTYGHQIDKDTETGVWVDADTGQIFVGDEEITLVLSEPQRKLIQFLCDRVGTVCSYDDIAVGVWGIGEGVSPGAIYELVKRVRQKIEPDWKKPRYIVTVPGKGYRLEP
ncbi:MAG: winged helix-turn-helix domain-containing protein [Anaerolineae bacterium]|nr:winged helix-turn-helix domain-containing protein [Anaerolineae bacterium]